MQGIATIGNAEVKQLEFLSGNTKRTCNWEWKTRNPKIFDIIHKECYKTKTKTTTPPKTTPTIGTCNSSDDCVTMMASCKDAGSILQLI